LQKTSCELPFDFVMRDGLAALDLINPLADGRQKIHALGDGIKAGVLRQTLNRVQDQLFITHAGTLHRPFPAAMAKPGQKLLTLILSFELEAFELKNKNSKLKILQPGQPEDLTARAGKANAE
jgi:hypothetical protein